MPSTGSAALRRRASLAYLSTHSKSFDPDFSVVLLNKLLVYKIQQTLFRMGNKLSVAKSPGMYQTCVCVHGNGAESAAYLNAAWHGSENAAWHQKLLHGIKKVTRQERQSAGHWVHASISPSRRATSMTPTGETSMNADDYVLLFLQGATGSCDKSKQLQQICR